MMASAMANPGFRAKVAQAEKRSAKLIGAAAAGVVPSRPGRRRRRARVGSLASNPNRVDPRGDFVAPSARMGRTVQTGMSDVMGHTISWLAGYVYVGNGTLGATDSVYLVDPSVTYTVTMNGFTGGYGLPVYESDSIFGASYALDVVKHYARIRRRRVTAHVRSLQPATDNNMEVIVAPTRGPSYVGSSTTGTSAAQSYTNVISTRGVKGAPCWGDVDLDLTSFIAGGSGSRQDEFDTNLGADIQTCISGASYELRGVLPCCLTASGKSSGTALRGTTTHAVFIEEVVDLLDWLGGTGVSNTVMRRPREPIGVVEEKSRLGPDGEWQHVSSAAAALAKLGTPVLRRAEPEARPDDRDGPESARTRSVPPGNRSKPAVS